MEKIGEEDTPQESISTDISRRTVAILLIIAVIISITSTIIAVARTPQAEPVTEDTASAQIRVNVVEPPEPVEAQIKVDVVEGE